MYAWYWINVIYPFSCLNFPFLKMNYGKTLFADSKDIFYKVSHIVILKREQQLQKIILKLLAQMNYCGQNMYEIFHMLKITS